MRIIEESTNVKIHVNPQRISKQMTFKEYLFNLPNEKLAEYLVTMREEEEYDYDYDDNLYCCGIRTWISTTDGRVFWDFEYEDAVKHQVEILESEYVEEETNDEN